jgi:hypothetical protein
VSIGQLDPKNKAILPYLVQALKNYPDVRVMKRSMDSNGEASCSSWMKLKNWNFHCMGDPTDIELAPGEIVFEADINSEHDNKDMADVVMSHLVSENIGFECWFSGNKSYHVYVNFPDLEKLDGDKRLLVKETLAKGLAGDVYGMLDSALFKSKAHMLSIRGGIHPITRQGKTLVSSFKHMKFNRLPIEIIEEAKDMHHKIDDICKITGPVPKLTECGLIDVALAKKIVSGNRNCLLLPNFLALNPSPDTIRQFSRIQEMSVTEICHWRKGGCYRGYFSCKQMKSFAAKAGLFGICKKCQYNI